MGKERAAWKAALPCIRVGFLSRNPQLRPEVFPLDTTIFSGKMRVSRLKHEHALEYERLFPDRVEDEPEADPSEATGPLMSTPEEGLAGT